MDTKTKGIIGLISILAIFGGAFVLSPNEMDYTYVCNTTKQVGIFYGGISSTGLTAYPYAENRTKSVKCPDGKWIKMSDYIKYNSLIINQTTQIAQKQWLCNTKECIEIK